MPELLEVEQHAAIGPRNGGPPAAPPRAPARDVPQLARDDLRRQIARLDRELGELFAGARGRGRIDWIVGAAGGPRVLGIAELERVRDGLYDRIAAAKREIARQADVAEAHRVLVERMIADPAEHRWVLVSNEDLGEPECKHWHSRPQWGILGMLLGWWRVKISSGCPLSKYIAHTFRRGFAGTLCSAPFGHRPIKQWQLLGLRPNLELLAGSLGWGWRARRLTKRGRIWPAGCRIRSTPGRQHVRSWSRYGVKVEEAPPAASRLRRE